MARARAYDCPRCGAALEYDPASGNLKCAYCDSEFTIDEVRRDEETAPSGDDKVSRLNWGDFADNLELHEMEDAVVYNCRNCGAQVVTNGVTAATVCPYCDSTLVVDERVSGGLRPNAVIPFRIPKDGLSDLLNEFYRDKPLLPDDFFSRNRVEKAQGVYVPFWLFDGTMNGGAEYHAENVLAYRQGDFDVVETQHFALSREGRVRFERIPVDGSDRMDDDMMDSVEPFDYQALTAFDSAYLSGFVADRYDRGPEDVLERASSRMINSANDLMSETCTGYVSVSPTSSNYQLDDAAVQYVLLPVYLFNTEYDGVKYRYAINGQTGKVVGEVPIDKRKLRRAFVRPAFITGLVTLIVGVGAAFALAL